MKTIGEVGPQVLGELKSRTIRSWAVGKITREDCNSVTDKIDDLLQTITDIREIKVREGD